MSVPKFDPKDWEDIIAYQEQYDNWLRTVKMIHPADITQEEKFAFIGSGMVMSSLALLKTQQDLEKLTKEVAKSQRTVEILTLLLVFFTVSLVLYSFLGSGATNTLIAIVLGGLITAIPFSIRKFWINVE